MMIAHGMRASLIAAILDMPLAQARALYEEITGRSSPSGQTPRSNDYYFAPVTRMHASAFLLQYRYLCSSTRGDTREAFVAAYHRYHAACCGAEGKADSETKAPAAMKFPRLPIDRAWRLVQLLRQADGTIREARCAKCRTYSIIQPFEAVTRYVCPACQGSLNVSMRLRGRSGRKSKRGQRSQVQARSVQVKRSVAAHHKAEPPRLRA